MLSHLIYSHKPQRSGRGVSANTNNPPQDPPPPHEEKKIPVEEKREIIQPVAKVTTTKKTIPKDEKPSQVPDIPIEDTTPPVPEVCPEEKPTLPKETTIPEKTPEPKVTVTTEIKTTKQQPQSKISWWRRFIGTIKKFFRR